MAATAARPLAETLAAFAVDFDLNTSAAREALLEKAKVHILDGIGVALASQTADDDYAEKILRVARTFGSAPTCTIIGYPERLAPPLAALVNGSLIHGCEFDDAYYERIVHAESFAVPVPLAIAEQRGLDGMAVVESFLVTTEVALRTACGANASLNDVGFHTTSIFGTVGAAAGAARLFGLDASRAADAIALSVSVTSGTTEGWKDLGGRNKCIQPGWAGMGGLMAAQMAEEGYVCSHSTLDGPRGLLASHSWQDGWNVAGALDGLGETWKCLNLAFKVYPCGARSQALLDCTRELVFEHDIKPEEVERVEVTMAAQFAREFVQGGYQKMFRPSSGYEMHGSWPCLAARMILSRRVGLEHLTLEAATEPAMLALADKVTCTAGPKDSLFGGDTCPARIVIHTPRGSFERTRERSTGWPETFRREYIVDKFRGNAGLILPEKNVEELIELIMDLEHVSDVTRITKLLVPSS